MDPFQTLAGPLFAFTQRRHRRWHSLGLVDFQLEVDMTWIEMDDKLHMSYEYHVIHFIWIHNDNIWIK